MATLKSYGRGKCLRAAFPKFTSPRKPFFLGQLMDRAFHALGFRKCCYSRKHMSNLFLADNSQTV